MNPAAQVLAALLVLYVALTPGLVRHLAVWLGFVDSRPARELHGAARSGLGITPGLVRRGGRVGGSPAPRTPRRVAGDQRGLPDSSMEDQLSDTTDQELPDTEAAAETASDDDHVTPDALSGAEDGAAATDEAAGSVDSDSDTGSHPV